MDALGLEEIVARFEVDSGRRRGPPPLQPRLAPRHPGSRSALADRVYLDKTGLVLQRGIADLMRYAALNNELDFFSNFGGFIPAGANFRTLPEPTSADVGGRYSDEQLLRPGGVSALAGSAAEPEPAQRAQRPGRARLPPRAVRTVPSGAAATRTTG